jgi:electron transport complex protein RnfE
MGIATAVVLLASCMIVSFLRKVISQQIRIPCFIIVCATFTTIVRFLMQAYLPSLNYALGIFVPLIAVNCLILGRMEAYAAKNPPLKTAFDALGMGIGFTLALFFIGLVREFLGSGTILGLITLPEAFPRMAIMTMPPGGFFVLGVLIAIFVVINKGRPPKKKSGCSAATPDCDHEANKEVGA